MRCISRISHIGAGGGRGRWNNIKECHFHNWFVKEIDTKKGQIR